MAILNLNIDISVCACALCEVSLYFIYSIASEIVSLQPGMLIVSLVMASLYAGSAVLVCHDLAWRRGRFGVQVSISLIS